MIKNAKMEKSNLTLSTYVQYAEDFKLGLMWRGGLIGFRKKLQNVLLNGLKPDIFREEMYSRTFENSDIVVWEARKELSTYRDILEISVHVKKSEPKKDFGKEKRE